MGIEISFNDAAEQIKKQTYLDLEQAAILLKLMNYTEKFRQTMGRLPNGEEHLEMSETARKDKSFFFHKLNYDSEHITRLAQTVNKKNPFLGE